VGDDAVGGAEGPRVDIDEIRRRIFESFCRSSSIVNPDRRGRVLSQYSITWISNIIVNSPSWSCRDGFEVGSAALDEMREYLRPVVAGVPTDFSGWVHLNGHNLRGAAALDDDDECTDAAVLSAALFATLNVGDDKRITDVCSWNDMCCSDRESRVVE
jgi:hypothetical protein